MARATIVTDSSACVPPPAEEVRVVPIAIRTLHGEMHDGEPGAAERVYRALRAGEQVKSSAPSPLEYLAAVERATSALIVTPAAEFTGMHRSATLAADLADVPIEVLDCRSAAAAQRLVVEEAAEAAKDGLDAAVAAAREASARVDLVATLDSLEHVRRSGRVPAVAVGLARRLHIRPVFRLRDGHVLRLGVPRSEEAALDRVAAEWRSRGGPGGRSVIFHAAAPDRAAALAALLEVSTICEFSPSMGIHTGPGVIGVAWLPAEAGGGRRTL